MIKTSSKVKWAVIGACSVVLALIIAGGTIGFATQTSQDYIGEEKAKSIALNHANVNEADISYIECRLDYDDGIAEYDVKYLIENIKYEYEINATSGNILSFDHELEESYTTVTTSDSSYIGEEKAKAVAMEHAGLTGDDISYITCKLDRDNGVYEYEVEFWDGSIEYDYEIDATTADVIGCNHETKVENSPVNPAGIEGATSTLNPTTENYITAEEAIAIAIQHAGVNEADALYLNCEFDYDDGLAEYEVEWRIGEMEYDYNIGAANGEIYEYDIERDD